MHKVCDMWIILLMMFSVTVDIEIKSNLLYKGYSSKTRVTV